MRIITGNDTNYISNKTSTAQRHYPSTKDSSPLGESQSSSNTGGAGVAYYTKFIDAFWDGLDTSDEVIMLNIIIKNAYFKGSCVIPLSYSLLSKYLKKKHESIDRTGQSLADKGYITKTFCLGRPNMYRIDIKKIENDFKINIKDYYPNWNITDNNTEHED